MEAKLFKDVSKEIEEKGVLIKLSGKALGAEDGSPYFLDNVEHIVNEICSVYEVLKKPKIAIVVGGGNIWRGSYGEEYGIEGAFSDEIGIFSTIPNAMMIAGKIARKFGDDKVELMLASTDNFAGTYSYRQAKKALEKGKIVVLGGGIGVPGMSTDFAAVSRAFDLELGAVLMTKNGTDGVYDRKLEEEGAKKYSTLNYLDFIVQELKVADNPAVSYAKEHLIPLIFLDFTLKGGLKRIASGEAIGTLVYNVPTSFDNNEIT